MSVAALCPPVVRGPWSGLEDVLREFNFHTCVALGGQLLFAEYDVDGYEGSSLVVWIDAAGELWEANSSHCSCNGLEWLPEKTTFAALLTRAEISRDKGVCAMLTRIYEAANTTA